MALVEELPIDVKTLTDIWNSSLLETEEKGKQSVINQGNIEFIAISIQEMINKKKDGVRIISFALWSVITMHPFSDGNHRTAVALFYYLSRILGLHKIEEMIDDDKISAYARTVDNKGLEQVYSDLLKMLG